MPTCCQIAKKPVCERDFGDQIRDETDSHFGASHVAVAAHRTAPQQSDRQRNFTVFDSTNLLPGDICSFPLIWLAASPAPLRG